jgi:hypothetical protein
MFPPSLVKSVNIPHVKRLLYRELVQNETWRAAAADSNDPNQNNRDLAELNIHNFCETRHEDKQIYWNLLMLEELGIESWEECSSLCWKRVRMEPETKDN